MKKSAFTFCALFSFSLAAAAQTGGVFEIRSGTIAPATGRATGGGLSADVTAGQTSAGNTSAGGGFSLRGGFWTPRALAPTAARVVVAGRVATADGRGIRNAVLTLTGPDGARRSALSGTFGAFRFDEIEAGRTYILSIVSRRFVFAAPVRVVDVRDEVADLIFTAEP